MIPESITILAINPGTKYLGFAIFEAQDLVYWGVKVLKGKWSEDKMMTAKKAIENLINQYRVHIMVLKKLHSSRSSKNLNFLVATIKKIANRKGVKLCLYTVNDIKKHLMSEGRLNKMAIAEIMTTRYPFLIHELEREKKHKHPYFVRMFEAIAAGIMALHRLGC